MLWNEIITQEDVKTFNNIFGEFHDSCLKEMCFSSGGYVSADLGMAVTEVEFSNIVQINIKPASQNNGVDIIRTHLYLEDEMFFWSEKDYQFWRKDKDRCTWIASKAVKWRVRDELLGEEKVYMKD